MSYLNNLTKLLLNHLTIIIILLYDLTDHDLTLLFKFYAYCQIKLFFMIYVKCLTISVKFYDVLIVFFGGI